MRLGVLLAALALLAGCGGNELSTDDLEREIRAEFEQGAEDRNESAVSEQEKIHIEQVACVRKSPSEATCRVDASEPTGPSRVDVVVDIDPDTGEYQWREASR